MLWSRCTDVEFSFVFNVRVINLSWKGNVERISIFGAFVHALTYEENYCSSLSMLCKMF